MAADKLKHAGRAGEALTWYQQAAEVGDDMAIWPATGILRDTGRIDDAISWLQQLALDGMSPPSFSSLLAEFLEQAGRLEEAITWYERAAADGEPLAMDKVIRTVGQLPAEEAMSRLAALARAGHDDAASEAAEVMIGVGRVGDAVEWLQNLGMTESRIAGELRRMNRRAEAIAWYQRAAEAGDRDAAREAAEMLAQAGRAEEAIEWYRRAARRVTATRPGREPTHACRCRSC